MRRPVAITLVLLGTGLLAGGCATCGEEPGGPDGEPVRVCRSPGSSSSSSGYTGGLWRTWHRGGKAARGGFGHRGHRGGG